MGEVKKPIWKKWWFWVIVVIVVAAIGSAGGKEEAKPTTTVPEQNQAQEQPDKQPEQAKEEPVEQPAKEEPAEEPKKESENKPTITKAEFEAIENGMTYEEVVKIIGGEGEMLSESGSKGDQFHTVMYKWDGEGDLGANANAMFQGGKLQMKAQFGLK